MLERLWGLFLLDSVTHSHTVNSDYNEILKIWLPPTLRSCYSCNAALVGASSAKPKASAMRGSSSASTDTAVKAKPKPAPQQIPATRIGSSTWIR